MATVVLAIATGRLATAIVDLTVIHAHLAVAIVAWGPVHARLVSAVVQMISATEAHVRLVMAPLREVHVRLDMADRAVPVPLLLAPILTHRLAEKHLNSQPHDARSHLVTAMARNHLATVLPSVSLTRQLALLAVATAAALTASPRVVTLVVADNVNKQFQACLPIIIGRA